jgi:predicted phage terminase large subunit-like protein
MARLTIGDDILDAEASLISLDRTECEESLAAFIKLAWHIVEPSQPYIHGWHIDALCMHLEAITDGVEIDGQPYNRLLCNIPPGPMREDSLVETARGIVELRHITTEDLVLTHKGKYRRVTAVHEQGVLPILKITTHSGRVTHAAPSHPYLTPSGWVDAGDLKIGDVLAVVNGAARPNDARHPSPEVARLLGYMVGDGSLTHGVKTFTNGDQNVIEDFERCCATVGFETTKKMRGSYWIVRIKGGASVQNFFANFGLDQSSSYTKRIPPQILNADCTTIANFIGAYWTCDGMIEVRATRSRGSAYRSSCTTVSEGLATDILFALTSLGIEGRIRTKARKLETARQLGGVYRSFNVEIQEEEYTAMFADLPGLCARKANLAAQCRRKFPELYWNDEIVSIEVDEPAPCRCLTVEYDHSFVCSGIAVKNTMKSLAVSVFWPAWEWGPAGLPHMRYICASHSQELAIRDNMRMRRLVSSDWYQKRWPLKIASDQNQKIKFENGYTGFRQAAAAGSITGSRGDRIIIDDPHSVEGATSDQMRKSTLDWFTEAVPTRLNNPDTSAIVVIMQRLHEEDVSGIILDKQLGYDHLCLPMKFERWRKSMPTKLGFIDPREEEGELLFPQRFPAHVIERDSKIMGIWATAGQFQQAPTPRGGGIIKAEYWNTWIEPVYPMMDCIVASLDTAFTTKSENDFSALTVWGVFTGAQTEFAGRWGSRDGKSLLEKGAEVIRFDEIQAMLRLQEKIAAGAELPKAMLMYAMNERLELHDLVVKVGDIMKKLKVDRLIIENKASGYSVAQEMRRLYSHENFSVVLLDPKGQDKVARVWSVQHLFAEGMIYAPDKTWANTVIQQCANFPKGKHDDLVDSVSQALIHMRRDMGLLTRAPEYVSEVQEGLRHRSAPLAPIYPV